jgi:predicted flavoprotein YhiN
VPRARVSFVAADQPGAAASGDPTTEKKKSKKKPRVFQQEGPLLITHQGLSGPAALRLSAFGAVELHGLNYRTLLKVHWAPQLGRTTEDVFQDLWRQSLIQPNRLVRTVCPLASAAPSASSPTPSVDRVDLPYDPAVDITGTSPLSAASSTASSSAAASPGAPAIPRRLWSSLVEASGLSDKTWAGASKKEVRALASLICETELRVEGRATYKDEFVTAGGVDLDEVDTRTMQSKVCPGLFVCGECTNVDGVTGGFNFMGCWYVPKLQASSLLVRFAGDASIAGPLVNTCFLQEHRIRRRHQCSGLRDGR